MSSRATTTLALLLGAIGAAPLAAQTPENDLEVRKVGPTQSLMVNGRPVMPDVKPQVIGGRMMVPIRFVAEELGASVTWNPQTRVVRILQGDKEVTMTVGSTRASVDGFGRALAVAPVIRDGRTLVPLRAVARFTGGFATYNPATRTVFVNTGGGPGNPEAGAIGGGL